MSHLAHPLAGLRVDDTQVDLMGGSDEASNERPSFVVPTGRAVRRKREKKSCSSCQEDIEMLRKEKKATVIVRHRVGRKRQVTVLLNRSKRRHGRITGRSVRVRYGRCSILTFR